MNNASLQTVIVGDFVIFFCGTEVLVKSTDNVHFMTEAEAKASKALAGKVLTVVTSPKGDRRICLWILQWVSLSDLTATGDRIDF